MTRLFRCRWVWRRGDSRWMRIIVDHTDEVHPVVYWAKALVRVSGFQIGMKGAVEEAPRDRGYDGEALQQTRAGRRAVGCCTTSGGEGPHDLVVSLWAAKDTGGRVPGTCGILPVRERRLAFGGRRGTRTLLQRDAHHRVLCHCEARSRALWGWCWGRRAGAGRGFGVE